MDKDRIVGAAKTAAGNVKQAVGRAIGDQKIIAEGKAETAKGKLQNAVGGIKDAVRSIVKNG